MALVKWNAAAIQTVLSTEMNALASAGVSALGPEYDNSGNLFLFADFQLDTTFAVAPTVNTPIVLFLVQAPDGTNYNNNTGYAGFARGGWQMLAVNTQQLLTISGLPLPPTKFKVQVQNQTNQPMQATGSTVKMIPYAYSVS